MERDRTASTPEKPSPSARAPGVGYYIRKAVIEAYPESASNEQIEKALGLAGHNAVKKTTIETYRTDCLATLRIAQELGRLSEPVAQSSEASEPETKPAQTEEPGIDPRAGADQAENADLPRAVADMRAEGKSYKVIAADLRISIAQARRLVAQIAQQEPASPRS